MRWRTRDSRSTKYGAIKTTVDGITFDSRAEARRFCELRLLQQAGEITGLTVHPRYELIPGAVIDGISEKPIRYTADFAYMEHGKLIVEDVKGAVTRDYELRRKMMLLLRGITIREIDAKTGKEREWRKKKSRTRKGCSTTS